MLLNAFVERFVFLTLTRAFGMGGDTRGFFFIIKGNVDSATGSFDCLKLSVAFKNALSLCACHNPNPNPAPSKAIHGAQLHAGSAAPAAAASSSAAAAAAAQA